METLKTSYEFDTIIKKEKVLVFFTADWSTPCKMTDIVLEEIETEHPELTYLKIDADRFRNIAKDYNVINVPVVCILQNGELLKTLNGVMRKEELVEIIQQL